MLKGWMSVLSSARRIIEKYTPNFLIEGLSKDELKEQINFFRSYEYVALKLINGSIFFVENEQIYDKCREVDRNTVFIPSTNLI